MVVSASELLFCLVLGGIGAIIVLVLTVVMGYLFKLVCRFSLGLHLISKKMKK